MTAPIAAAETPQAWHSGPAWFLDAIASAGVSGRVVVDGASLHYRGWGLDHRDRPVVWLVHGFGGHGGWWDFVAPALAERHRVIALDLSGMGDSDHRAGGYPAGTASNDIIGAIDALGVGPVIGIGHSAGGLRLLMAAAARPDLFRSLMIIDSYVVFSGEAHPERPPAVKGDRVHPDLASALARYRLLPEQAVVQPWALDYIARRSVKQVEGGWRWKFDPALPVGAHLEADGNELLPRVGMPVYYIYGEASSVVSPALARRIVSLLPQGRGPIGVPDAAHHMMIDQPQSLIATLRALLA